MEDGKQPKQIVCIDIGIDSSANETGPNNPPQHVVEKNVEKDYILCSSVFIKLKTKQNKTIYIVRDTFVHKKSIF